MSKIGEAIKARGLTVYKVIQLSGIPKTTMYQYVRGEKDLRRARYETIRKLCDVLKADADEIV